MMASTSSAGLPGGSGMGGGGGVRPKLDEVNCPEHPDAHMIEDYRAGHLELHSEQ